MCKVSVIIPTWNRANLLKKSIESALNQTMPSLEVLVCDDGSTDNTVEIVKNIKDSRVKLILGQHGGRPAIPRNRGLKIAKGEWITFLDDDDELLPQNLEKKLEVAKKTGYKAICEQSYILIPGNGIQDSILQSQNKEVINFYDMLNYMI